MRFYRGLFDGTLLPPALLAELCALRRTVSSHPRFVTPSYGLGLMADPDWPYGAAYGHNGSGPGYGGSAFRFTSSAGAISGGMTIALLCNTESTEETEGMLMMLAETFHRPPTT